MSKTVGEGTMMRDFRITAYAEELARALKSRYSGMRLEMGSRRSFESFDGYAVVSPLSVDEGKLAP